AEVAAATPKRHLITGFSAPRRRQGTGLRQKDDGGGSMVMITMALRAKCRHQPMSAAAKKYRCRTYTPSRRGNVTAIKDDGGIELTRPTIEKLSLQDLYPPSAARKGLRQKDDGGVNNLRSDMSEKIIAAGPIPPVAGEERDSDKRTMSGGLKDLD